MNVYYQIHFRKPLKKNSIFPVTIVVGQNKTVERYGLLNFVTNITKNYQYTSCPDSLH